MHHWSRQVLGVEVRWVVRPQDLVYRNSLLLKIVQVVDADHHDHRNILRTENSA